MAKMRITIEYPLDGSDQTKEQRDWIEGNVTFQDVWYLFEQGDEGYKVKFETTEEE
jgi:hypothetical protein